MNEIRVSHKKICRICGKDINNPYRVFSTNGKVMAGCVASDHNGKLVGASESAFWHNRNEAKAIRANLRKSFGIK